MPLISRPTRELFANLVRREVRGRYKGSWLGVVWTLVTPLVMMGAYSLVFTVLWQIVNIPDYPIFLLSGLAFWNFLTASLIVGATSLVANADLVKKVSFPRQMVPLAAMVSQGLTALVMVVILIPFGLWLMPGSRAVMLLLPLVIIFSVALVAGLCLAISVINVYFRDTEHIISALMLPWFFITPVLYSFASFPLGGSHEWIIKVLTYLNFATTFVMAFQYVLFWGRLPPLGISLYVVLVGTGALIGGWLLFNRMQRDLAVEL